MLITMGQQAALAGPRGKQPDPGENVVLTIDENPVHL